MANQSERIYVGTQLLSTLERWSAAVIRDLGRTSITDTQEEQKRRRNNKVAVLYGFPVERVLDKSTKKASKSTQAEPPIEANFGFDLVAADFIIVHESSLSHRLEFERELLDVSCFIPGGARPIGVWYRQVVEVGISAPSDVDSTQQPDFNLQEICRNADAAVERFGGQYFPEFSQFFLGSNGPVIIMSCVRPSMSDASSPPRFENFFYRLTTEKHVESHAGVMLHAAPPEHKESGTTKAAKTDVKNYASNAASQIYEDFLQRRIPFRTRVSVRALIKTSDSKRRLLQNIESAFADLQDHLFPTDRSTYFSFQPNNATAGNFQDRRVVIGIEKQAPVKIRRSRASSSSELSLTNTPGNNVHVVDAGSEDTLVISSSAKKMPPGSDRNYANVSCRDFAKYVEECVGTTASATDEKTTGLVSSTTNKGFYSMLNSARWLEAQPLLEGCAQWQSELAGRSPLITISSKSVMEIPVVLDAVGFVHESTPVKFLPSFMEDALVRQLNATCYLLKLAVHASTYANQFTSSSLTRERVLGVTARHRSSSRSDAHLSGSDSGEDMTSLTGDFDANDQLFQDDDANGVRGSPGRMDDEQLRQNTASERAWKQLFEFTPQVGHYFVEHPICRVFSIVNVPTASRAAHFINTRLASRLTTSFFLYQTASSTSNNTPVMRPSLLTPEASLQANRQLLGGYLVCPHWHVKLPEEAVQTNMLVACCKGLYTYHHYMHENYNDKGWGCAYRSLQTVWSWLRLNGAVVAPAKSAAAVAPPAAAAALLLPPQHRVVQQTLVAIGDKPPTFVGSKQWIGSMELGFFLNQHYGIECRYLRVESGEEMPTLARQLLHHFETEGCPVMIGGGQLAHTILGVAFRDSDGYCQWLVLDPHYTGSDNIDLIVAGGWCGWKETSFWLKQHYYNLCLPRVAQR